MSEWCEITLGDLVEAAGGLIKTGPFGSQLHAYEYTDDPLGTPVVMPRDMTNGRVDELSISRVDGRTADRLGAHRLAAGDVVLARRGEVGRFAFIEEHQSGWLCGTGSMRVHAPDPSAVYPRFLRYAMSHPRVAEWFNGQAVGATMANLNALIVAALPLWMPAVSSQRRIAAVLSAFDELIEINERRIELLEDLARTLYHEWIVRFRFPGHEYVEFVDSELGPIPDGWRISPLSEVGDFLNGFAFKPAHHKGQGLPIIKIKELKNGVTPSTPRYGGFELDSKYLVDPGDLLFSWSADLGVYIWSGEKGVLNQHLFNVLPKDGMTREFLFHALQQALPQFRDRAQGTTMRHIKRSALTEVKCAVPPLDVLAAFSTVIAPLHSEVVMLRHEAAAAASTRDLLLPRLVTGGLDISDVDLGGLLSTEAA